ncbi:MAG TPA: VWA domain-containing protein [Deltaproteobacteria bacterium]|nr:VWA domain-containing protein [Deltaproteobacteria bacterium]
MDCTPSEHACVGGENLSGYWRCNTSHLESLELANLLRALRKVAGYLGPNVGSVEYAGMGGTAPSSIWIEPGMVKGTYPVPEENVDCLVGIVVHEALHQLEWSDRVWRILETDFAAMSPQSLVRFQKVVSTGEHLYVDSTVRYSILEGYLEKARNRVFLEYEAEGGDMAETFDSLILLWWKRACGLGHVGDRGDTYGEALACLERLTAACDALKQRESSISSRCEARASLYRSCWKDLEGMVSRYRIVNKRLSWVPRHLADRGKRSEGSTHNRQIGEDLSHGLARDIQTHVAADSADITPLIASVVGYDNPDLVATSRWDYAIPAQPVIDKVLVGRIRSIFTTYSSRESLESRGLSSGRIDSRRLYRAPVSGRCFSYRQWRPAMDWNVTLLIDASASMRGGKWRMVENTVSTLHKALSGYRNRFGAYAYFEQDRVCMISRLTRDGKVFSVPPTGQTASGQAIIACALFMPPERRRKILIHVTDGKSNYGCDVSYGIEYCALKKIHLVTLGCGCQDTDAMERQYGNTLEFLESFRQLPHAIEQLLRRTFLYCSNRASLSRSTGCRKPGEVQGEQAKGRESLENP